MDLVSQVKVLCHALSKKRINLIKFAFLTRQHAHRPLVWSVRREVRASTNLSIRGKLAIWARCGPIHKRPLGRVVG